MNPPSLLYGAMNKERKPFTYTPGGLDLSEIKSERMAKRLIRNAMDQGVPEQPISNLQSPSTPPTTFNVPNFNCLPVQVFPTFTLPANPKSLLRTRSNSTNKELYKEDISYSDKLTTNAKQIGSKEYFEDNAKNSSICNKSIYESLNNDRPAFAYEYNTSPKVDIHSNAGYGSCGFTEPILAKSALPDGTQGAYASEPSLNISSNIPIQPELTSNYRSDKNEMKSIPEITGTEVKQEEVRVSTKEIKNESAIEQQNGDTNIDTNVEAAVTVKLPAKKSSAKTETKVEVVKKILPDGSVEEVKTTTTKTTIDGKTEITTKTETTVIPKDIELEDEELVEEEEEEEDEEVVENGDKEVIQEVKEEVAEKITKQEEMIDDDSPAEVSQYRNESNQNITKQEEVSESSITKKVTIVQSTNSEENSEEEIEEEEEDNDDNIEETTKTETEENQQEVVEDNKVESEIKNDQEEDEKSEIYDNVGKMQAQQENNIINKSEEVHESVEENEEEEKENLDKNESMKLEKKELLSQVEEKEDDFLEGKEPRNQEKDETLENEANNENNNIKETFDETVEQCLQPVQENEEKIVIEAQVLKPNLPTKEETKAEQSTNVKENEDRVYIQTDRKIPLREPSVPLEKVEDVEIKPIGQIISKSHTENTEIITTSIDKPSTGLSTQTAYNRIENIVTVNRTTKTLDHAYEEMAQRGVPTVKTYFSPKMERLTTSPQPSRNYQPVYPPQPHTERKHSLLLDRLSVDRQMPPTELYQNNYQCDNQTYEQNQWSQEPQSEVLTVSNVKPSSITKNQQWYLQTKKEEIAYDNTILNVPSQQWVPQQSQIQPQLPPQPPIQSQYQPQTQFQPSYIDTQNSLRTTSNSSGTFQHNSYPNYTPNPTSWVSNNVSPPKAIPTVNKQGNNYSYVEKEGLDNYQKPTQQFSSSYIPPPWEQDSNYVPDNTNQTYYPPPTSNKFTNSDNQIWAPAATSKFTKPKPTSYIPPAPNQSFVKPDSSVEPPKQPGRKTYYSEYERRFISVPESTYIPNENKLQPQPDPSPQYYYDNNEPSETVEHEWRKELREFSEKTQTQSLSEQTLVKPPWEEDPKYYVPKVTTEYNPTPTWSQTLRPRSWRERSFESEFVRSKDVPKSNTLGRGRPQSSYVKSNVAAPIPERTRGVSVDRYNPNNYKSPGPSEYAPVQSHTLEPVIGAKTHHNPNVPAYHSRASAEPREQVPVYPQTRQWGGARASPLQSRSFKYLQWITGTED